MIEKNMSIDTEGCKITFKSPLIKDAGLLTDNKQQAVGMAADLERRLKKIGQLESYNTELKEFINRGVVKELSCEDMEQWKGPINYISHHGVPKPGSETTKLRTTRASATMIFLSRDQIVLFLLLRL